MTQDLVLFCDAGPWAQCHFVRELARMAESKWNLKPFVGVGAFPYMKDKLFYSPCQSAADRFIEEATRTSTGLWSHCSYGGWFTDDPLDESKLPKAPFHVTNAYQYHHFKGKYPYLPAGVNTDMFRPGLEPKGVERRLRVGWTGSMQYNAALKLFLDRLVPAVRLAGSDGWISEAKIEFRPLAVWNCNDARHPQEVAEYLKEIDVYVCTSISEGSSLSVLEAAAAGCVIISTPCGNAPELVVNKRLLVDWTPKNIAEAILLLHEERGMLRDLSEQTRELVEREWAWSSSPRGEQWLEWITGSKDCYFRPSVNHDVLKVSREYRLRSEPKLIRGDMMGS